MTHAQIDTQAVERFLRVRGWKLDSILSYPGLLIYIKAPFAVCIEPDCINISRWVENERWDAARKDCSALAELEAELVSLGAMEWECPNCGETGGTPAYNFSREYQGVSPHGGMVQFEERGCSKCIRGRR